MPRRTLITDTFNRADSGTLGANWTVPTGTATDSPQIVSNQVQAATVASANDCIATYNATALPNDQWASIVLGAIGSGSEYNAVSVGVRWDATAQTGYLLMLDIQPSVIFRVSLQIYTDGTIAHNTPPGFVTVTPTPGDVFWVGIVGTTLTGYQNDVPIISDTVTNFASGRPAIELYPFAALGDAVLDSFTAGDFITGAGSYLHRVQMGNT